MHENEISGEIIGAAIEVHKELGPGLLESISEEGLVVEAKSVERILPVHEAQLLSYLRLSRKRLGLQISFNGLNLSQ